MFVVCVGVACCVCVLRDLIVLNGLSVMTELCVLCVWSGLSIVYVVFCCV